MHAIRSVFSVYIRTVVFGISDGIVSTVGLLAGLAIAGAASGTIEITGVIYAFVEASSMAVGAFLSEESAEEYVEGGPIRERLPAVAGTVMFFTFVLASLSALVPYLLFDPWLGSIVSVLWALFALFIAGILGANLGRSSAVTQGLRAAVLGALAIMVGLGVGVLYRP